MASEELSITLLLQVELRRTLGLLMAQGLNASGITADLEHRLHRLHELKQGGCVEQSVGSMQSGVDWAQPS